MASDASFTGVMKVTIARAECLKMPSASRKKTVDPYVMLQLDTKLIGKTFVAARSESPIWMESFQTTANRAETLEMIAMSKTAFGEGVFLSSLKVPLTDCIDGIAGKADLWVSPCCQDRTSFTFPD